LRENQITTKNPTVSVIIPTYCEQESIEWCLKSIQGQEFEKDRIETIVVDSNSPDNTRAIATKYAEKVINIKARGVGKARNVGAQEAKGDILLFLDADTVLDPRFLAKLVGSFFDDEVVCVSGAVAGLERRGVFNNLFAVSHYSIMNKVASLSAQLGFPLFPTVCCACRRSVFRGNGGFDEELAIGEDLVFSRKMGKVGKCLVNSEAKAYTSLRRVEKWGLMKTYYTYFRNYFKVFVLDEKPWIQDFPNLQEI